MVLGEKGPVLFIFMSSSILRARLQEGKNMFACFVDFKKAFVWINRDLLEYELIY